MRKIKQLPFDLAEKTSLPPEILPGAATVHLTAGRQALVEEQRGVLEYSAERVVLALSRGKLILSGSGLRLNAMNGGELMIVGRIERLEWE